jgi:hypothetical protein
LACVGESLTGLAVAILGLADNDPVSRRLMPGSVALVVSPIRVAGVALDSFLDAEISTADA